MKKIHSIFTAQKHIFVLAFILTCMVTGWYACSTNKDNKLKNGKDTESSKDSTKPKNDSLNSKVKIEIINKEFQNSSTADPKDYNVIVYKLTNNTGKNMKEIEADATIYDLSGNEIKKLKITELEAIPANTSKEYKALYSYNAFSEKDVNLKNTDLNSIRFDSNVLLILYEDGTKETGN